MTLPQNVEVKRVRGLLLDLGVIPVLPRQQVESELLKRLTPAYGRRPDSAACVGDLTGEVGSAMECVVTSEGNPDSYVVTVTSVDGSALNFDYRSKSGASGSPKPGVDLCPGCPG
jgi:hypothetical protein